MITQKQLKELLHYNPDTGIFTNRVRRSQSSKIGDVAGCNSADGYLAIKISGKKYKGHRLAWLYVSGELPLNQIDHINGITSDNRIVNLRNVSHAENCKNQKLRNTNTSGITGVGWHKGNKKWLSKICVDDKIIHLGVFIDKFEAICARKSASNKYGFHQNHGRIL
tara:strand:- start:21 stop:518 length:498 start_codon:yes stop_codon:yes gene_type:complete